MPDARTPSSAVPTCDIDLLHNEEFKQKSCKNTELQYACVLLIYCMCGDKTLFLCKEVEFFAHVLMAAGHTLQHA